MSWLQMLLDSSSSSEDDEIFADVVKQAADVIAFIAQEGDEEDEPAPRTRQAATNRDREGWFIFFYNFIFRFIFLHLKFYNICIFRIIVLDLYRLQLTCRCPREINT